MIVVGYGGGVNSTAMLIGLWERKESVDLILFANTGGEKPGTYAYRDRFSAWLTSHGFPPIITVQKMTKRKGKFHGPGELLTLEQHCLETGFMPSVAYGNKSCSMKFKREPQNEYVEEDCRAWADWLCGRDVTKLIGFDADESHRSGSLADSGYRNRYPLIEWGWGREECVEAITRVGLCVPPKSSCFFCPNMSELEILELRNTHPELLARALEIEDRAKTTMHGEIRGLARNESWRTILEFDAKQKSFIQRGRPVLPCECYDG